MSKVLVTGGLGFIGSFIVEQLLEHGKEVRVLDNLDPQVHPQGKPDYEFLSKIEFMEKDAADPSVWAEALDGVDAVIHDAAAVGVGQSQYQISHYCNVNVMGTAHMLDYMANNKHGVKKMLVAASMSSYGEGKYVDEEGKVVRPGLRSQEDVLKNGWEPLCPETGKKLESAATEEVDLRNPTSIYAINKMTQEDLIHCFGQTYGIPTTALRYFNVFGPRQSLSNPYTGVLAIFTSRLKNDHAPVVYEDGKQTRDFIHVRDIARANVLALESDDANGESFNLGSGRARSISSVAKSIAGVLGKDIDPEITHKFRQGDVRHCYAAIKKAEEKIGFKAEVDFEEGLAELSRWSESVVAEDQFVKAETELKKRGLI